LSKGESGLERAVVFIVIDPLVGLIHRYHIQPSIKIWGRWASFFLGFLTKGHLSYISMDNLGSPDKALNVGR
jgi:hypothetical protein